MVGRGRPVAVAMWPGPRALRKSAWSVWSASLAADPLALRVSLRVTAKSGHGASASAEALFPLLGLGVDLGAPPGRPASAAIVVVERRAAALGDPPNSPSAPSARERHGLVLRAVLPRLPLPRPCDLGAALGASRSFALLEAIIALHVLQPALPTGGVVVRHVAEVLVALGRALGRDLGLATLLVARAVGGVRIHLLPVEAPAGVVAPATDLGSGLQPPVLVGQHPLPARRAVLGLPHDSVDGVGAEDAESGALPHLTDPSLLGLGGGVIRVQEPERGASAGCGDGDEPAAARVVRVLIGAAAAANGEEQLRRGRCRPHAATRTLRSRSMRARARSFS